MVYGAKEILADTLMMIVDDIKLPHAYPIAQMIVLYFSESELSDLMSKLGACNKEDSALRFSNGGRDEDATESYRREEHERRSRQIEILFPLIPTALRLNGEYLAEHEQRDVTCHYHCIQHDPRDEMSLHIRMVSEAVS